MAAEREHRGGAGGYARVDERDVARGRRGGKEHRRRRGARVPAQRRQREQGVRGRDGVLDLAGREVDGADAVVVRRRVGHGGVRRVEAGGRGGRAVHGHQAQRPALRRRRRARQLPPLGFGGAGAGEEVRWRGGRGRLGGRPEAHGAVGRGAEHAARGSVDVQRVDARRVAVELEARLQRALQPALRLGVLPYAHGAVEAGGGDLRRREEPRGLGARRVPAGRRGPRHAAPRGVPDPQHPVVRRRQHAVLVQAQLAAGPEARARGRGEHVDVADPVVVLEARLVRRRYQAAHVLDGQRLLCVQAARDEVFLQRGAEVLSVYEEVEGHGRGGVEHGRRVEDPR